MDQFFVLLLIICGLLGLYVLPYNCFSGIAFIYLLYALLSKKIKFGSVNRNLLRVSLWMVGISAGGFLLISSFLNMPKIGQNMNYFLFEVIPFSVYEEAVYRGILIMFLKDLLYSESKILYIQAFFFWISHISYLIESPSTFWVFIPILGLTLGCIALRTKSITLSAIAHILINAFSVSISLSW
jgi:membrane protease YdiL (CAAX protease family)